MEEKKKEEQKAEKEARGQGQTADLSRSRATRASEGAASDIPAALETPVSGREKRRVPSMEDGGMLPPCRSLIMPQSLGEQGSIAGPPHVSRETEEEEETMQALAAIATGLSVVYHPAPAMSQQTQQYSGHSCLNSS